MYAEIKWSALESMLASSGSVVALAKIIDDPEIKTVIRTISILKTKITKQPAQQILIQTATKDTEQKVTKPVSPQKTLPST